MSLDVMWLLLGILFGWIAASAFRDSILHVQPVNDEPAYDLFECRCNVCTHEFRLLVPIGFNRSSLHCPRCGSKDLEHERVDDENSP